METVQKLKEEIKTILSSMQEALGQMTAEQAEQIQLDNLTKGEEILSLIDEILFIEPYDIYAYQERIKINQWFYDNTQAIIDDAEFIRQNEAFKENRTIGYDWLIWAYEEKLGMPEKARELIFEELGELPDWFEKKHALDKQEGILLDKLAWIELATANDEDALNEWIASYKKYPFLHNRNKDAGLLALEHKRFDEAQEFLWTYWEWSNSNGNYQNPLIDKALKEFMSQSNCNNHPGLIALYYQIECDTHLAGDMAAIKKFADKNLDTIVQYHAIFPDEIVFAQCLAAIYSKLGNTQQSYQYRVLAAGSSHGSVYNSPEILYEYAQKLNRDFFEIEYSFEGPTASLFNLLTDFYRLWQTYKDKRFLKLAMQFGEKCHHQFNDYFEKGIGSTENNQPLVFADACHNYGLVIRMLSADDDAGDTATPEACAKAAAIHWQGYQVNPYWENVYYAALNAYRAGLYEDCIQYVQALLKDFTASLTNLHVQQTYWWLIESHLKLDNYTAAEEAYIKSKQLYIEHTDGDVDATKRFMFNAKTIFTYLDEKRDTSDFFLQELQTYLANENFVQYMPVEYALNSFIYAATLYKLNRKQDALPYYEKTARLLYEHTIGVDNHYNIRLELSKQFYAEIAGKQLVLGEDLNGLFSEKEIAIIKQYPLHPDNDEKNIEIILAIAEKFLKDKDYTEMWIDDEKNICFSVERLTLNAARGESAITVDVKKWQKNHSQCTLYRFDVREKVAPAEGLFSKKDELISRKLFASRSSNFEEQDFYRLNDKKFAPQTEAQKAAADDGQKWWDEICNRFYQ